MPLQHSRSTAAAAGILALAVSPVLLTAAQQIPSETTFEFTADDVSGSLEDETTMTPDGDAVGFADITPATQAELEAVAEEVTDGDVIYRKEFPPIDNLVRICGCTNDEFDFEPIAPDIIRQKSNNFLQGGVIPATRDGWSNLLWAWGQFMDHDMVATVEDDEDDDPSFDAVINKGGQSEIMTLHRLTVDDDGPCRSPKVTGSPVIDASQIYGSDESYLQRVLREPGSCKLRSSAGNLLPVTTSPDEGGQNRFVAGDARVNEHAILTGMHTLWLREHNRICDVLDGDASNNMDADEKFNRARQVVIAKTQQITLREFLPTLGITEEDVRGFSPKVMTPAISIEFFITYRFGHDLIRDDIGTFKVKDIFNGEEFFGISSAEGAGDPDKANADFERLYEQARTSLSGNLDGKFADSLRNFLFGPFGEDLPTRNMWRSMEVGMVPYDDLAACYGVTPTPTVSGFSDNAGDDVPALALMWENNRPTGKPFGVVNTAILTDQFHRLFFGKDGLWWEDDLGKVDGFEAEVASSTLGTVMDANLQGSYSGEVFRV